jgi:hypothetical protein
MPGGDRTGPEGRGPLTGRRQGFCAGFESAGYDRPNYIVGRGFGRGFWGRGRRYWWRDIRSSNSYQRRINPEFVSTDDEKAFLEESIKNLDEEIKSIRKRLEQISKEKN